MPTAYTGRVNDFERAVAADVGAAVARLRQSGVPVEALAEYVPGRRRFLISRAAVLQPIGEVWRLGVLLIRADVDVPQLYAAGQATRAAVRLHPGNQSVSREERRDIAAAAITGGYAEGTPVNYAAAPIALDEASLRLLESDAPLGIIESEGGPQVRVRWRAGAGLESAQPLREYLFERIELLS